MSEAFDKQLEEQYEALQEDPNEGQHEGKHKYDQYMPIWGPSGLWCELMICSCGAQASAHTGKPIKPSDGNRSTITFHTDLLGH